VSIAEVDVATEAVAWLTADSWDPHFEVTLPGSKDRADIVATRDGKLVVVETKLTLSFDLLEQGFRWKPYANAVWVAVPAAQPTPGRRLAYRVAEKYLMIGVLEVGDGSPKIRAPAPELSRMDDALLLALRPEHKTFARAGSPAGGQATPYKTTCEALRSFVSDNPGCTAEEATASIRHHYRSNDKAAEYLLKDAKNGEIEGVKVGWRQRLWPTEGEDRGENR
jgi:hypothetical protein